MLKLYILFMIVCPPASAGSVCVQLIDTYSPQRTMEACLQHGTDTTKQLLQQGYTIKEWTCKEKNI